MAFLLDTNAVIALLNDAASPIARRVRRHAPADVFVSAIVLHELFYGAFKSQRAARNVALIDMLQFSALEFSREDARDAGPVRALLATQGTPIGPYDALIAGQARAPSVGFSPPATDFRSAQGRGRVSPPEGVQVGSTTYCPTIAEFASESYLIPMLKAARLGLLILTVLSLALAGPVQANCDRQPAAPSTPCGDMTMGADDPGRPQPDAPQKACAIVQCPSALPQFAGVANELELPIARAIRRTFASSPAPAGANPAPEQRPPIS